MLHEPKEDCFAFKNKFMNGCTALNQLECKYGTTGKCAFYKPAAKMKGYKFNRKERSNE